MGAYGRSSGDVLRARYHDARATDLAFGPPGPFRPRAPPMGAGINRVSKRSRLDSGVDGCPHRRVEGTCQQLLDHFGGEQGRQMITALTTSTGPEELYLNLLARCLTRTLFGDSYVHVRPPR